MPRCKTNTSIFIARTQRNATLRITLNMKVSHARNVVRKYRFLQDGYEVRDNVLKTENIDVWCKCSIGPDR